VKINRNNYEAYFLDYHEGKISSADKAELENFLSQNVDLENEFNDFVNFSILPEKVVFAEKNILKKELSDISVINNENFDEFCVAKLEGDLSDIENLTFEKYLKNNSDKAHDYKIYLKTLLEPDRSIVFADKGQLKRRKLQIKANSIYFWVSAAASIALILFVYIVFNNPFASNKIAKKEIRIESPNNQNLEVRRTAVLNTKVQNIKEELVLSKNLNIVYNQADSSSTKKISIEDKPDNLSAIQSIYLSNLPQVTKDQQLCNSKGLLIDQNNRNSTYANTLTNFSEFVLSNINGIVKNKYLEYFNNDRLDIKSLAMSGLKSFGESTGMNLKIDKEIDSSGSRTVYAFNSKLLSFYSSHENK
jgi:hypothetical protein